MDENKSQTPGFTNEGFKVPVDFGRVKSYATVNVDVENDDESHGTKGEYFIYLPDHKCGSCHFSIELDENNIWQSINAPEWLEDEIVKQIVKGIIEHSSAG